MNSITRNLPVEQVIKIKTMSSRKQVQKFISEKGEKGKVIVEFCTYEPNDFYDSFEHGLFPKYIPGLLVTLKIREKQIEKYVEIGNYYDIADKDGNTSVEINGILFTISWKEKALTEGNFIDKIKDLIIISDPDKFVPKTPEEDKLWRKRCGEPVQTKRCDDVAPDTTKKDGRTW